MNLFHLFPSLRKAYRCIKKHEHRTNEAIFFGVLSLPVTVTAHLMQMACSFVIIVIIIITIPS